MFERKIISLILVLGVLLGWHTVNAKETNSANVIIDTNKYNYVSIICADKETVSIKLIGGETTNIKESTLKSYDILDYYFKADGLCTLNLQGDSFAVIYRGGSNYEILYTTIDKNVIKSLFATGRTFSPTPGIWNAITPITTTGDISKGELIIVVTIFGSIMIFLVFLLRKSNKKAIKTAKQKKRKEQANKITQELKIKENEEMAAYLKSLDAMYANYPEEDPILVLKDYPDEHNNSVPSKKIIENTPDDEDDDLFLDENYY